VKLQDKNIKGRILNYFNQSAWELFFYKLYSNHLDNTNLSSAIEDEEEMENSVFLLFAIRASRLSRVVSREGEERNATSHILPRERHQPLTYRRSARRNISFASLHIANLARESFGRKVIAARREIQYFCFQSLLIKLHDAWNQRRWSKERHESTRYVYYIFNRERVFSFFLELWFRLLFNDRN